MLSQIYNGKTLVVTKLDYVGRYAQDIGATIKAAAARRIEVIVLEPGKLDLTSAADSSC
jgi:putative DNA-invertase from lambdoid prophage Rac